MNDKYLSLITSQYKGKPNFQSFLLSFLNKADDLWNCADTITQAFDIDNAEGAQLDILGEILGLSRQLNFQPQNGPSTMTDEYYRLCLQCRVIYNSWDGSRKGLENSLQFAFPSAAFILVDNQDMSINIVYQAGEADAYSLELLNHGYMLPKPSGVRVNYSINQSVLFGWDSASGVLYGWDIGTWL